MSKFNSGDRVQIHGEPTDWDVGTVVTCNSSYGEDYCNVEWDSSGLAGCYEDDLFLVCAVADRPKDKPAFPALTKFANIDATTKPKHAAPATDDDRYCLPVTSVTAAEAVSLASKLLQFATQEGTE